MATAERRGLAQRIVRFLANLVYREIDVHGYGPDLRDGPILAVANHFGGLSDGVLLIDSSPRMPRIVARDVIWKVPLLGWLATRIGMIPVHKAEDGSRSSNDQMFASAYRALGENEVLLIFPEGLTMDVPHMAQVRTGAARIALGARASGVAGIRILPIGVHYENKAGFRTRALVNLDKPIDLDAWAAARPGGVHDGADDREAVEALTGVIDQRLRHAAPDFPDWITVRAFHQVAEVLLEDVEPAPDAQLRYGDVELLAARLNRVGEPARTELLTSAEAYRDALRAAGTSDKAIAFTVGRVAARPWRWLRDLLLALVLLPFAAAGLVAAAIPLVLVLLVSRLPIAPAVRATMVPGVALLAFSAEWLWLAWGLGANGGWDLGTGVVLLFPFFVGALFLFTELSALLWRRWRARREPKPSALPALQRLRAQVADQAWDAL